jgi:PAS domain S-box-containing protein
MIDHLQHEFTDLSESIRATPQFPLEKVGTWLSAVLQSSMDGVIVIDASGQIVLLNREAERMFGYDAQAILCKPMDPLLPTRLRAEHRQQMERFTSAPLNGRRLRIKLDLIGLHANGHEFFIETSISRVTVRGEIFLAIILREIAPQSDSNMLIASKNADLRRLAVSSQQANEVEKRRFSKELYDDLGQRLSVLKLDLDWLENNLPATDPLIRERIAQMQRMLGNSITRTKGIASTLRPPLLDDFGLIPAIEWITENFYKKTAITCTLENHGIAINAGDPAESAVFRVVQESLLNVERHAKASHVKIILQHKDKFFNILIEDNGIGMIPGHENKPGCYGLITMQERVYILGGTISIQNIEPTGFAIRASIPIG